MITRHHVMLVLLSSLIVSSAIMTSDPGLAFLVVVGAVIGAILPDVQMKRPRDSPLRTIAWAVVRAGRLVCMPVICFIFEKGFNIPAKTDDKRVTHSVVGLIICFLILSSIATCLVLLLPYWVSPIPVIALLAGVLLGFLLHLIEDMCCRRGVLLFYPFSDLVIYGSIRPCDVLDRRITGFHVYHGMVLFFFLVFLDAFTLPLSLLIGVSFIAIGICVLTMAWQSEVSTGIRENRLPDGSEVPST